MQLASYKCKYCDFECNIKTEFRDHLVLHLKYGTTNKGLRRMKRQLIINENKQLKNLIAAIDKYEMSFKDYKKYQPLLDRVREKVVN